MPRAKRARPFVALDEFDRALLLSKAFVSELQSEGHWVDAAIAVLGRPHPRAQEQLTGQAGKERMDALVDEGRVVEQEGWRTKEYGMAFQQTFDVLHEANELGVLGPAIDIAWRLRERRWSGYRLSGSTAGLARALLVAGRLGDASKALATRGQREDAWRRLPLEDDAAPELVRILGIGPPAQWLGAVPDAQLAQYAKQLGAWACTGFHPLDRQGVETLLGHLDSRTGLKPIKRYPEPLLRAALISLPPESSAGVLRLRGKAVRERLTVLHEFVAGNLSAAFEAGRAVMAARGGLRNLERFAFLLACVDAGRCGDKDGWVTFRAALDDEHAQGEDVDAAMLLEDLADVEAGTGDRAEVRGALEDMFSGGRRPDWTAVLMGALMSRWFELQPNRGLRARLQAIASRLSHPATAAARQNVFGQSLAALAGMDGEGALENIYAPRPAWAHMVEQLEALADEIAPVESSDKRRPDFRPHVVWEVVDSSETALPDVVPRVVSSPRSSTGRAVSFDELARKYQELLDRNDESVVAAFFETREAVERHYFAEGFDRAGERVQGSVLLALVGHPRVRGPEGPLDMRAGSPRVVVDANEERAKISVEPEELAQHGVWCAWAGQRRDRLTVFQVDERISQVLRAIQGSGGVLPLDVLETVRPTLVRLSGKMSVEGRGGVNLEGDPVEPDSTLRVDLEWHDPTLALHIGVRPLGRDGPIFEAAKGSVRVVGQVAGALLSTKRDFDVERAALQALERELPELATLERDRDDARFVGGFLEACELLERLTAAATQGLCELGWPRRKPLRISREYSSTDFKVRVRQDRPDWLGLEAGVQADEAEVFSWRLLAEHGGSKAGFVRIDDQRVLKLSTDLQRKLAALEQLDQGGQGLDQAAPALVPELVLPALDELLGGEGALDLVGDVAERRREIEAALASKPRTPRTLRAKLRDYQREGYRWMARLASAGLGGVLADDMGLGKTVQTLALLLSRRDLGPAMVVCPTSVAENWCTEAARFAPSLEMVRIGSLPGKERGPALRGLGPRQVAVLSYGILARLEDEFGDVHVSTLIFDEAHALKNSRASRTQTSHEISRDVCFCLTGTPIENHLGELWSVMNVCVPGLLGTEKAFGKGIARDIERGRTAAATHLRALLRPFLLRRTKEMVLAELPERTESTVTVSPSEQEQAWYEAQRQVAEARVAKAAKKGDTGLKRNQARIALLAEIGKLRRAAVEPRLVDEAAPEGAKLQAVLERARALVDAGHQVLVFTQFLGVIDILGTRLRRAGIRVLELQGSTPGPERARRIEQFQAGEADVFLMSLKAGGIGVNLTAADYVLHVDPWWNPAAEDQATGRAHRMGQTRPVTVYRFCTAGSIEQKILAMHDDKRGLAEDILSGMAASKKLDLDELRALVAGT